MPIPTKKNLTAEEARTVLEYDRLTGILRWRRNTLRSKAWNSRWAGKVTGYLDKKSQCVQVRVNDENYLAHRLAWLIETGEWPEEEIDHRNGKRSDNRWENLREATHGQNMRNRAKQRNNQSGFLGVRYRPHHGRWEARITVAGRLVWHVYADTAEQADALRREVLPQYHGEFVRET